MARRIEHWPLLLPIVLVAVLAMGCRSTAPLPRNDAQVYLLRGHNDWYSEGIDALGQSLRSHGCDAIVLPQAHSKALGQALTTRDRAAGPLVLIGFSFGADEALRVARRLSQVDRRVDLLVTIDPVTPPRVPANAGACVNYYQSNGVRDLLPWLRGVPVAAGRGAVAPTNYDLRRNRTDLLQPDTSHATISLHRKLHVEIIRQVVGVFAPAGTLSDSIP